MIKKIKPTKNDLEIFFFLHCVKTSKNLSLYLNLTHRTIKNYLWYFLVAIEGWINSSMFDRGHMSCIYQRWLAHSDQWYPYPIAWKLLSMFYEESRLRWDTMGNILSITAILLCYYLFHGTIHVKNFIFTVRIGIFVT